MSIRKRMWIRAGAAALGLAMFGQRAAARDARHAAEAEAPGLVPPSVAAEHDELHEELARVIESGGRTAAAGRDVEKLLAPHFAKEQKFALPPLSALAGLASGKLPPNVAEIVRMSDQLKSELPAMLAEHAAIGKALARLRAAAQDEHKPDAARFAAHLAAHARQEEEVLYPAAILAGQYLKLRQR